MKLPHTLLEEKHLPVMLNEVIKICSPQSSGVYLDCTFGAGGYSKAILKFKGTKVVALDRDHRVKKIADKLKEKFHSRFSFHTKRFSDLDKISTNKLDAVIFDLGISSMQLDDLSRGFSFKSNSELDMSMGLSNNTLKNVINKYDVTDLKNILKFLGDEEDAGKIAKNIIIQRGHKSIVTTNELVEIIKKSKKKDFKKKIDASTKTFQALRIFVNQEISELIEGIIKAAKILKPGGKLIIVSFHSLEDKIVKYFFKNFAKNYSRQNKYLPEKKELNVSLFEIYKNKTFKASKEEIKANPRARSAKLRVAIRSDVKFQEPEDLKKNLNILLIWRKKMRNKKLLVSIVIFSFLLFFTSIIKNKTRVIEKNINNLERKISHVEKELYESQLDFHYLSSPNMLQDKISFLTSEQYQFMSLSKIYLNYDHFISEKKKLTKK